MQHDKSQISSPFSQVCQVKELNHFHFTTKNSVELGLLHLLPPIICLIVVCVTPDELQFFALAVAQSCNMFNDTFMLSEQPDFRS